MQFLCACSKWHSCALRLSSVKAQLRSYLAIGKFSASPHIGDFCLAKLADITLQLKTGKGLCHLLIDIEGRRKKAAVNVSAQ